MLTLGSLAFAAPWILAGLASLPILWWLLRITPPAPREVLFPPIRLLFDLRPKEETPAHTPLWLLLLRMLLAALVIVALARPLLNPAAELTGSGPLVLVVDDGWAAAPRWRERQTLMQELIDRAERADKRVILITTAPAPGGEPHRPPEPMRAADARLAAQALQPKPWPADREATRERLAEFTVEGSSNVFWLSDGLDAPGSAALAERLQRLGGLRLYADGGDGLARLVLPPVSEPDGLVVPVRRAGEAGEARLALRATAEDGRLLGREEITIAAGQRGAEARLVLPAELRNRVHRIEIEGESSAGATVLVDERWRRRPVGIVTAGTVDASQPLLSDVYYLRRALNPFSEVRVGTVADLLRRELAVILLPDTGVLADGERESVQRWLDNGGLVLRFAGPRLAVSPDAMVPVTLRRGDRRLGGALSWSQPARLAPFDGSSPFAGLPIPPDVTVNRQVLAEPALDLAEKTWVRLADGTPLVTADRRGKGWLVLIHTTASTEWSNLALSGLFVEMLQRLVALSEGVAAEGTGTGNLPPLEVLDGFGRPRAAPPTATAIRAEQYPDTVVGPRHPPGFYGDQTAKRALNLSAATQSVAPLPALAPGVGVAGYDRSGEVDLRPWLLVAAFLIALADLLIGFALRGYLRRPRAVAASLLAGALAIALPSGPAEAQLDDSFAIEATSETRLAYVRTGNPSIDQTSAAGLRGLSNVLNRRTATDMAEPMGVDIDRDELAFFPMLYWPVVAEQATPSAATTQRLNAYLRNGGTIVFDTRDQGEGAASSLTGGGVRRLRALTEGLAIGALVPVPPDHVLTKAFYLMQDFPGRLVGGQVWVEQLDDRVNDGVASVIIGANDWASAWAVDGDGRPLHAVVPGGEQQREMAYRFGVNLVMYALTGNYKADQVHVPAILERLGQ